MRTNERNLMIGAGVLVLVLGFWFLVLGPMRDRASKLGSQVSDLNASLAQQEQRVQFGQQAESDFPVDYQRVVVLGKAAPQSADSASMMVQLSGLARKAGVDFRGIELQTSSPDSATSGSTSAQPGLSAAPPASSQPSTTQPAPPSGQSSTPGSSQSSTSTTPTAPAATPAAATAATPAAATEASASTLAIGAQVGPAGLSVLPYKLTFSGDFFNIANFLHEVDQLVRTSGGRTVVNGRLSTVDGFSLSRNGTKGFPHLTASVFVSTYLTPPDQGLTGGATPSGPAPAVPGQGQLQTTSAHGGA